ncbi:MAG TPA: uracil-DNA glycosylase family protein [Gaiellaceae bacterium]|nr:uracil-DNA glycosylase family protein [Gaiellaceae bacterium]
MTRRRSSYRSIASLQRDNRVCRACVEAGYPLESLPIVQPYTGQRAYIHGQAPGAVEGVERLPWRGRAGRTLRRWLEMDEDGFYGTFYCASVTRCYPGKARSGNGDRTPTPEEQALCSFWREWELELIRPELILVVGGLSARRLLGITNLGETIGRRYELNGATAIPLPHPSGTSRWLNDRANRARLGEALAVVSEELRRLRTAPPPSTP